jgi:hypothetical protein
MPSGSNEYINICPTCHQPLTDIRIIEEGRRENVVNYRIFYGIIDVGWIREVYACYEGKKYNREFYVMIFDISKKKAITDFLLEIWLPKESIVGFRGFYDLKCITKSDC